MPKPRMLAITFNQDVQDVGISEILRLNDLQMCMQDRTEIQCRLYFRNREDLVTVRSYLESQEVSVGKEAVFNEKNEERYKLYTLDVNKVLRELISILQKHFVIWPELVK